MSEPNTTACSFRADSDEGNSENFGLRTKCPSYPDRAISVSYTDTSANWAQTVDHCENVLVSLETEDDGRITRTYVTWGPAGVNTVAFNRPTSLSVPSHHNIKLVSGFELQTQTHESSPTCEMSGDPAVQRQASLASYASNMSEPAGSCNFRANDEIVGND